MLLVSEGLLLIHIFFSLASHSMMFYPNCLTLRMTKIMSEQNASPSLSKCYSSCSYRVIYGFHSDLKHSYLNLTMFRALQQTWHVAYWKALFWQQIFSKIHLLTGGPSSELCSIQKSLGKMQVFFIAKVSGPCKLKQHIIEIYFKGYFKIFCNRPKTSPGCTLFFAQKTWK